MPLTLPPVLGAGVLAAGVLAAGVLAAGVLPAGVLAMDLMLLILILVNRRNWQSYMMSQIFTLLLSVVPVILYLINVIHFPYLAWIAFGASAFLFLGTLILGDRRARTELKRRFHI